MAIESGDGTGERATGGEAGLQERAGGVRSRTVARVQFGERPLGPLPREQAGASGDRTEAVAAALERIEHTVRAGDRVCPCGTSRILVAFGPDAEAVAPRVLGERLARAVSQQPSDSRCPPGWPDARMTAGPGHLPHDPVEDEIAAQVVVDRFGYCDLPVGHGPTGMPGTALRRRLRRRTVVHCAIGRPAGYGSRHDDPMLQGGQALGAVLVVDPDPTASGTPGLSALAARSSAEGLGFKVGVTLLTDDGELITEVDGIPLDLVVLMVGSEPDCERLEWSTSTWRIPAQLTAAYRAAGVDVLAVSAGAGAGALAGCLEHGASLLFDLNTLPEELSALGRTGGLSPDRVIEGSGPGIPPALQALLQLTSSERRVLFYLTAGRSAQEIAGEVVVSLATVRSHIRSILRKLGVRSQLAAVALANRRGQHLTAWHSTDQDERVDSSHRYGGEVGPRAVGA